MQSNSSTEPEIWKDIPGWEGLYQVSTCGRVRSLDRICGGRQLRGKERKAHVCGNGYKTVCLCDTRSRTKQLTIHSLVAQAFLPKQEGMEYVDHINGDRLDNRVSNLRFTTNSSNMVNMRKPGKIVGVSWWKEKNKWRARLSLMGKEISRTFFDFNDAVAYRAKILRDNNLYNHDAFTLVGVDHAQ